MLTIYPADTSNFYFYQIYMSNRTKIKKMLENVNGMDLL